MVITERTLYLLALEGDLCAREVLHVGKQLKHHISRDTTITYWQTPNTMQVAITERKQK